jgi:hypothetical protein
VVGRSSQNGTAAAKSTVVGRRPAAAAAALSPATKELDAIRLNLHPIAPPSAEKTVSVVHEVDAAATHRHRRAAAAAEEEDGVKRISEAAIQNIRREAANVVNFNFHEKAGSVNNKSHLPGMGSSPPPPTDYHRPPQTAKQACSATVKQVLN